MRYYLREMHQCVFNQVLLELKDDTNPPLPHETHYGAIAHSKTRYIPELKKHVKTWHNGDVTGSSDITNGCHVGACVEITKKEAMQILLEMYQDDLDLLVKKIHSNGYGIRARWADEYGGEQSICSGVTFLVENI